MGSIIPITADPPLRSDFLTAYALAVDGDTILFPLNKSATWTDGVTVSKSITIDGNGTTLTAGALWLTGFFHITGFTSSTLTRITGFTFDALDFTSGRKCIKVLHSLNLTSLRIDHNTFYYGYETIEIGGVFGVIDNNTFYNPLMAVAFSGGSDEQATASWASMDAGTSSALFIENNSFVYNASYPAAYSQESIGTYNGGKLVVRYNTWDGSLYPSDINGNLVPIMTHGSAAGGVANGYWQIGTGGRRGQSVVEMYENTISGKRFDYLCILRGSANLVYDNTLDTQTNNPRVVIYEEEQYDESNWTPLRTAWPAEDQVHNSFFWNNTLRLNGVVNSAYVEVVNDSGTYIQENRDYFLHAPQAAGGYEYFTGANGASSSYPTDGDTYPTLGTMVFDADHANAYYGYVPYTYPHPLTFPVDAPSSLSATAISTSVISLAWTNNAVDATSIKIERSSDNVTFSEIDSIDQAETTYDATGLASATQFWFRVRAHNANGYSAYSNTATATTDTAPVIGPGMVVQRGVMML